METITARDMNIGDIVRFAGEQTMVWGQMLVQNKTADKVTLKRPYLVVQDFIHTGGVSSSTDYEIVDVHLTSSMRFELVKREDPEQHYKRMQILKSQCVELMQAGKIPDAIRKLNEMV